MPPYRHGTTIRKKKPYPRVSAGPLRGKYVHRVVAAALIGRDLARDEEVHHKDGNKLNYDWKNIFVLGNKDHGWVSAKQAWFMRERDVQEKKAFDEFMAAEYVSFAKAVQEAKANGVPWLNDDGHIAERYDYAKEGRHCSL